MFKGSCHFVPHSDSVKGSCHFVPHSDSVDLIFFNV
uniref:Uncharacterized protein n=1 Tax=Lepeophtheirus salmonis TaxID=72036 RepID=A0A0K2VFM3_LEPSM